MTVLTGDITEMIATDTTVLAMKETRRAKSTAQGETREHREKAHRPMKEARGSQEASTGAGAAAAAIDPERATSTMNVAATGTTAATASGATATTTAIVTDLNGTEDDATVATVTANATADEARAATLTTPKSEQAI